MKKKKGFTLIEMIASMAMLVLIFSVIASLMLLAIKTNVRNEKDLDSNSVSKAFVELVNSDKSADYKVNTSGIYILAFKDTTELQNIFNTDFIPQNPSIIKPVNFDISTLASTKKYAIKVNVIKDPGLDILKFEITSWNLNKINTSEIYREIYIAHSEVD